MKQLLTEAKAFLVDWIKELKLRQNHAAVLDAEALQDITEETDAVRQKCAQEAYAARVADEEGIACIEEALADGLQPEDLPAIKKALRHFRRSRAHDNALAERLS